jgi:mannose-1-phosphate guanylyltransferase/phosphomannomutase
MIKRAIISGLPSAGVNVWDLGSQPIPIVRYFTRISEVQGGVHVRLSPFDQRVVDVLFIDSQGLNLNKNQERTIEHVFFREDFRRVYLDDIGTIEYAGQARERYIEDFLKYINTTAIQEDQFELVVAFADDPVAEVLPTILEKLHCNVVALNTHTDKIRLGSDPPQFQTALKQLQIIASALGAQLGASLSAGGERLYLVDDRGYLLQDITTCAALVDMALRDVPGGAVAVPANMPNLFELIAERYSGKIIRTEIETDALLRVTCSENVIMAGDGKGKFIFPDFHCAVDGLMALAKTLEYLATQKNSLGNVVANLPPYHLAERRVSCVWEAKARVMRLIHEKFEMYGSQIINGVKVQLDQKKWVLIVPDPDQPYFSITAEAENQEGAEALVEEYAQIVERISPLE